MKHPLSILTLLAGMAISGHVKAQTYNSSGPVLVTPGISCPGLGDPSSSVINVPGSGTISSASDVFLHVNLSSVCFATLKLVLMAPNGDSCILLNMPHRTDDCEASICAEASDINTLTFNATYTTLIPEESPVPSGNYAPTGSSFAPQIGNLDTFLSGRTINGNWSLKGLSDANLGLTISSWSIVFGSTALPLDLIGFSGYAYTGYNELKWSTASEKNTASFDIQRSVDGITYQTTGAVRAEGSGSNNYRFQDDNFSSGLNMYRLRMVDRDGSYTYSKTIVKISGKTGKDKGISFSPNPAKDVLNLTISNKELLHTDGKIINSLGQIVYTFKINQESILCNINHLPAGIYFISVNEGNHARFVKEN